MYVLELVIYDDFGIPQESVPLNAGTDRDSIRQQVLLENFTGNGDSNVEARERGI